MMRFGICAGLTEARTAAEAGYDFLEVNVQSTLMPTADDATFEAQRQAAAQLPIPVEAANCLLPADLKICGPAADLTRLQSYLDTALSRARALGIRVVVFGSGKARSIPEGFDRQQGWKHLVEAGRRMGRVAEIHGVCIAVEPLRRQESNVLNTIAETARYVREVNHPQVRLLVDSFHWAAEREAPEVIIEAAPLLVHVHVATFGERLAPGLEPCDFGPFFDALRRAGYEGRVSIEARFNDLNREAARARQVLLEVCRQSA